MGARTAIDRAASVLLAGSEVFLGLCVMLVATLIHFWNAWGARLYCTATPGEDVWFSRGGWAEPSWCHSESGGMDGAEIRPFSLFQPRWSFLLWVAVLVGTPVLTAWLVRGTERMVRRADDELDAARDAARG